VGGRRAEVASGAMYYVYILASIRRILYIGITNDLDRRITEHRHGKHPDSFASKYHCDHLVHVEDFTDVKQAIAREKELKGWRRDKKLHLIERTNPDWLDLAPPARPCPSLRSG
jgi:putative endonuclease